LRGKPDHRAKKWPKTRHSQAQLRIDKKKTTKKEANETRINSAIQDFVVKVPLPGFT